MNLLIVLLLIGRLTTAQEPDPVELSCRNCPLLNPNRTPEMIEAEERLRKDLFHNKLVAAFRNFKPMMEAMRHGGPHVEIPAPVMTDLRSYRNEHFEEEVVKPFDIRNQRMYILGDEIKQRRRRSSSDQEASFCTGDDSAICVEMAMPSYFEYGNARDTKLWIYPVPFPDSTISVEVEALATSRTTMRSRIDQQNGAESEGWLHFDITPIMRRWKRSHTNTSSTKVLRVKANSGQLRIASSGSKRPYLEVQIEPNLSRQKRGEARRRCPVGSHSYCCPRPLFYNFTEYNFTFIQQPPDGIDIGYCSGGCKVIETTRQTLVINEAARHNALVYPCCVPSRFSDTTIIYSVNGTLYTGRLANFVVEDCECGI